MYVLVRDARAFSCVGSGVDDLRLVHAAGEGVRLLIRRLLVLDSPREGRRGRAELAQPVLVLGMAL